MNLTGRIHSMETFGAVDGPGIRVVVFFQGCPLRCLYCHNPDTWNPSGGHELSSQELIQEIRKYKSFIKHGGVTLSGGEPLLQHRFAKEIVLLCKENGFHTAIDTSGCIPLDKCADVVDITDLIILDIKSVDDYQSESLTKMGAKNAKTLLSYCEDKQKEVWIRQVILPGWTESVDYMHRLGEFLQHFSCVKKVELLPFHKTGEYKWKELGLDYILYNTPPPDEKTLQYLEDLLALYIQSKI